MAKTRQELGREVEAAKTAWRAGGCEGSIRMSRAAWRSIHPDYRNEDARAPRCLAQVPARGTCSIPVEFTGGPARVAAPRVGPGSEAARGAEANSAATAYRARRAAIAVLLRDIKVALAEHGRRVAERPGDWGYAGDLGDLEEQLGEALRSIRGAGGAR